MKNSVVVGLVAGALLLGQLPASTAIPFIPQATFSTPTNTFASPKYTATRTASGMIFEGKIVGINNVTLRVSASPITTQTGWYYQTTVNADDTVRIVADEQGTGKPLYWQVEETGSRNNVLVSGQLSATENGTITPTPTPSPSDPVVTPTPTPSPSDPVVTPTPTPTPTTPTPTPTPTTPPVTTGDMTNGSGGALTNQTFQSFTSNGLTSQYHIYASGLDWSKKVGVLVYGDGSGGYGFDNPSGSYLIGGTNGLAAVAKKHNMVLVVPVAPAPGCDGTDNCWYDSNGAAKAKWSADLVRKIHGQYNIDKSRTAIGGYSSGAQWTSQFFGPGHASALMTDGVLAPIAYGGAPRVTSTYTDAIKKNVVISWDVGANDTSALSSARSGESWYKNQGFTTEFLVVPNKGHGRSGEFGGIMDREITQHVKPTS